MSTTLIFGRRVVTCDSSRHGPDGLGVLEHAVVALDDGRIQRVESHVERPSESDARVLEAALVTPGLVDAHTHAAWMGSRHDEYALRMAGADYEAIARSGGGIVSSMKAVRAATVEQIADALEQRVHRMASLGVTTVEVKSGYGLSAEAEGKQLAAMAHASGRVGSPDIVPTYLALHALPPEAESRDAYAREALSGLEHMARTYDFRFVDAYVERSAFSVEQVEPLCARARALGLGVRLHVGQFADVGGAELAARVGAASVDHLEHVSEPGVRALAAHGVAAVLLPIASFTLGQAPPDVALLRSHGVPLVVASDANPGTAPSESLPLALAFAVKSYGLSVREAVLGATREAARSLGLLDRGVLSAGARADVVLWDLPHEAALVQPHGLSRTIAVFSAGGEIWAAKTTAR